MLYTDLYLNPCVYRSKRTAVQIFVKIVNFDKTITLEVDPAESIESIKKKIQEKESIPTDQQLLTHSEVELKDGHSLNDYDIGPQSTIMLSVSGDNTFQISVSTTSAAGIQQRKASYCGDNEKMRFFLELPAGTLSVSYTPYSQTSSVHDELATTEQELSLRLFQANVASVIPEKWQAMAIELDLPM